MRRRVAVPEGIAAGNTHRACHRRRIRESMSGVISFGDSDTASPMWPRRRHHPHRQPSCASAATQAAAEITDVAPVILRIARAAGVQGLVILEAVIGEDGRRA